MKVKTALVGINGYAQSHLNQLKQLVESGQIEFPAAVVRRVREHRRIWRISSRSDVKSSIPLMKWFGPLRPEAGTGLSADRDFLA